MKYVINSQITSVITITGFFLSYQYFENMKGKTQLLFESYDIIKIHVCLYLHESLVNGSFLTAVVRVLSKRKR